LFFILVQTCFSLDKQTKDEINSFKRRYKTLINQNQNQTPQFDETDYLAQPCYILPTNKKCFLNYKNCIWNPYNSFCQKLEEVERCMSLECENSCIRANICAWLKEDGICIPIKSQEALRLEQEYFKNNLEKINKQFSKDKSRLTQYEFNEGQKGPDTYRESEEEDKDTK